MFIKVLAGNFFIYTDAKTYLFTFDGLIIRGIESPAYLSPTHEELLAIYQHLLEVDRIYRVYPRELTDKYWTGNFDQVVLTKAWSIASFLERHEVFKDGEAIIAQLAGTELLLELQGFRRAILLELQSRNVSNDVLPEKDEL